MASSETPIMPTMKPGTIVDGRLEVQNLIASGGFGSVYKVRHLMMNKTLALKTLHPVVKSDTTILRLKRESVAVAKLDHPNIVHATDFGLIDGTVPFIVMEYVEGQTLSECMKGRPPLSVDEALRLFIPICEALAYAHDQGVIHRDIKPGNIMLSIDDKNPSRVVPKIVDFGIAKLTFGEDAAGLTLTRTGDVFGTPLYMSPEQCAGTSVDHRADIYSLGCVLFETLTGTPPFTGNTALETMMRHASGDIPTLKEASLGKDFPAALEFIVAKMIAKDMRHRYQNCYDVANDLGQILQGDAASVSNKAISARTAKSAGPVRRMDQFVVTLIGLATLTIGIGCGIALQPLLFRPSPVSMPRDPFNSPNIDAPTTKHEDVVLPGFFRDEANPNLFHFPRPPKPDLGTLFWVTPDQHIHQAIAQNDVNVALNVKLELLPSYTLMTSPAYWGCFRSTDLWGLYLKSVSASIGADSESEFSDAQLAAAWQQRNLGMLELKTMAVHERAFQLINSMPKLTSLTLQKVEIVDESDPMKATQLTAQQLSKLTCLKQLDTLRLSDVTGSLTPILQQLQHGHLRRLAIWSCDLSEEDLKLIAQIPSLETLQVLSDIPIDKQFEHFSRMPKLKRLAVLALGVPIKGTYKFDHLEVFFLANAEREAQLRAEYRKSLVMPPNFDWNKQFQIDETPPNNWFNQIN